MGLYFSSVHDEAIRRYNVEQDIAAKSRIFSVEIRPAFEKLIESLMLTYRFSYLDDVETLKADCLTALYEALPRFDGTRGTKAFSYFNVIAKNWFIFKYREFVKRGRTEGEFRPDIDYETEAPHESLIEEKERWEELYLAMEGWREDVEKKADLQVLEAVIFLMRNSGLVPIYNRKAVFLYLREMTGLNTKQVVGGLKRVTALYHDWKEGFETDGGLFLSDDV